MNLPSFGCKDFLFQFPFRAWGSSQVRSFPHQYLINNDSIIHKLYFYSEKVHSGSNFFYSIEFHQKIYLKGNNYHPNLPARYCEPKRPYHRSFLFHKTSALMGPKSINRSSRTPLHSLLAHILLLYRWVSLQMCCYQEKCSNWRPSRISTASAYFINMMKLIG